jgi:hypothetical protein
MISEKKNGNVVIFASDRKEAQILEHYHINPVTNAITQTQ